MITVKSLSEFLVCQEENCNLPQSICHEKYFSIIHRDQIDTKYSTHKYQKLENSIQFTNFMKIASIQTLLRKKISATLNSFNTDSQSVVNAALYSSEIFNQIFESSTEAKGEFYSMRLVQKGVQAKFGENLSSQFCQTLLFLSDSLIKKGIKSLLSESKEWQFLQSEFNIMSGTNSSQLQIFIQREQSYFIDYCQKLQENKKDFIISEYLGQRLQGKTYESDPQYFSKEFTNFLLDKYEKNPEQQQIFTAVEYYQNFWQYFYVLIDSNKAVSNYFDAEINLYKQYEVYLKQIEVTESILSYRLWKSNNQPQNALANLKNPFFLESFIYCYIQHIIEKKIVSENQQKQYDWKSFAQYIQEFVGYSQKKSTVFDFNSYRDYFDFRIKIAALELDLEKKTDIVFNRKLFIEYLQYQYASETKLSIKKYKRFLEKKNQDQLKSLASFKEQSDKLKQQLQEQEKEHFYQIIYLNYLNYSSEQGLKISKEQYYEFKKNALSTIDETYIQQEDEKYRKALSLHQKQLESAEKPQSKVKINEDIDEVEEELAQTFEKKDEEEDFDQVPDEQICICCKGQPYDCKEPECMVMGCCTSCMLG